jgi:EAL domain-containing protein (putative c-di-GMP-specific phosphodiesterase class I)
LPEIDPASLASAIQTGQLSLVYQPKIMLGTRTLAGVEALARWRHPALGNIPPSDFIPVAETCGLIDPLTQWAVATAASDWTAWRQRGLTTNIAINCSAKSLEKLDFPDTIDRICQLHGMSCEHLVIELTETFNGNWIALMDTLTRFRIKGFKISLDDFGTGYSSMVQILRAPFSELKIDRSIVTNADSSKDCRIILNAIIGMAHNLGLPAVAEGVETESVAALLADLGCEMAQGYYFAKPMPASSEDLWHFRTTSN